MTRKHPHIKKITTPELPTIFGFMVIALIICLAVHKFFSLDPVTILALPLAVGVITALALMQVNPKHSKTEATAFIALPFAPYIALQIIFENFASAPSLLWFLYHH